MEVPWQAFVREAADLAHVVRDRIEQHGLALLATLTSDGSPRISGLEPMFVGDDLWFGMMPNSVKGRDLRRDGRFALHNATIDKDVTDGDVKIHGVAHLTTDRDAAGAPNIGAQADLFRTALSRVSSVRVQDGHLVIQTWRPGRGVHTQRRT